MKISLHSCSLLSAAAFVAGASAIPATAATLNTQWQTGYTGSEAGTELLWKFDGADQPARLNDSSNKNRDATLRGAAADLGVAGKFGTGLRVDVIPIPGATIATGSRGGVTYSGSGNADRIALSDAVTKALTVEFWYKPLDTSFGYLVDKKQASSLGYGFFLQRLASGDLVFEVGKDEGLATERSESVSSASTTPTLTWDTSTWYHIAGTFENVGNFDGEGDVDEAIVTVWRDGTLLGTRTLNDFGDITTNNRNFGVGDRENGTNGSGDARGFYDEVRISSVAYAFVVPEPATFGLLAAGAWLCMGRGRRAI